MTQRIYTLQLILLSAGYADKPTQTYLYLTGRSDINGIQTEHSTPDAGGKSGVVPTGRLDGRGNSSVPEIVRLSETDKKFISDSGATAVELDDYTEQPAVFSSALETARETDTINGWAVSPQKALDGEYTEYSQDYLDSLPESMMSTHSQIA